MYPQPYFESTGKGPLRPRMTKAPLTASPWPVPTEPSARSVSSCLYLRCRGPPKPASIIANATRLDFSGGRRDNVRGMLRRPYGPAPSRVPAFFTSRKAGTMSGNGTSGRIVMIDNYDSFTYNLVQFLGRPGSRLARLPQRPRHPGRDRGAQTRGHRHLPGTPAPPTRPASPAGWSASWGRRSRCWESAWGTSASAKSSGESGPSALRYARQDFRRPP